MSVVLSSVHFLDTNILLYSISRNSDEAEKRECSIELLDQDDRALSIQVFQEFYVQATSSTRSDRVRHEIAARLIRTWGRFKVQDINLHIFERALILKAKTGFFYWDNTIVAAACALGCSKIYSEDLSHGQKVENLPDAL